MVHKDNLKGSVSMQSYRITADEAKKRLEEGNYNYVNTNKYSCVTSPERLRSFSEHGQQPYAIIITCSDSRVVPELIFSAEIGDLFVIRVAGNVIDSHQLGSIEYAASNTSEQVLSLFSGMINAVLLMRL